MAEAATLTLVQDPQIQFDQEVFLNRKAATNKEHLLLYGKLGEPKTLEGSRGRVSLVDVGNVTKAIVKWQEYSDVQCETAAFVVSDVLGFDLVPATVIRTLNGRQASLQEFIPNASLAHEVDEKLFADDFFALWVFDHIIRSNDRDAWNVLFQGSKLIAIDHEAAFYSLDSEADYDTFKTFYGQPAPKMVTQVFEKYFKDPAIEMQLKDNLAGLLKQKGVDETVRRVNRIGNVLIQNGKIESPKSI